MNRLPRAARAAALCVALVGICPAAEAQAQQEISQTSAVIPTLPVAMPGALTPGALTIVAAPAASAPFEVAALADDNLGAIAGRQDSYQASVANLAAGVSHNSVGNNVQTGDAKISDNAFQNLSGLSIINVNTGNNVAINAAMNVNISISPGQ